MSVWSWNNKVRVHTVTHLDTYTSCWEWVSVLFAEVVWAKPTYTLFVPRDWSNCHCLCTWEWSEQARLTQTCPSPAITPSLPSHLLEPAIEKCGLDHILFTSCLHLRHKGRIPCDQTKPRGPWHQLALWHGLIQNLTQYIIAPPAAGQIGLCLRHSGGAPLAGMLQMLPHSREDVCVYTFNLMLIKFTSYFVHIDYSLHPFVGLVFVHFWSIGAMVLTQRQYCS